MAKIQIDMFEVQLGSAVLLQFETAEGVVRVLADAGISRQASGYSRDHVYRKLQAMLGPRFRLDLVVGTHYDEDHLRGLVPIFEDDAIEVGEVWLPPVANDTLNVAIDSGIDPSSLLARQFASEAGEVVLNGYLNAKGNDVELLRRLERRLSGDRNAELSEMHTESVLARDTRITLTDRVHFFREHLRGDDTHDHAAELDSETDPAVDELLADLNSRRWTTGPVIEWYADEDRSFFATVSQRASLANLRSLTATDAINAASLFEVVKALENRRVKPAVRTEIIEDGTPRNYRWDANSERFILSPSGGEGLRFALLGPSKSLVKKHRDRLPVIELAKFAMTFSGEIRSITPSNQLSYIGRFEHGRQGILITGDAGCVDFKGSGSTYHQGLLDAMLPLHVIQVAHHAGNNAHFYRVLSAAKYPEQTAASYLLLSHAFHDKSRPSPVFHDFLLATVGLGDVVSLLFTSEPTRDKVDDFLEAIHPLAGGAKANVGDIRLAFDQGRWKVLEHRIQVV